MQLSAPISRVLHAALLASAALAFRASLARADDHVETTTTWYEERRKGTKGGLSVITPMFDLAFDLGQVTNLDLGYTADAVSGATAAVYSPDAVSSATTFSDFRQEGHAALTFTGHRSSLNLAGSVGTERDYLSLTAGGGGTVDLPGKNTTLAIQYAHNFDQICDHDNSMVTSVLEARPLSGVDPCAKNDGVFGKDTPGMTVWHDVSIDTAQGSVTQNLSPTMNLQVALWGQIINGFQSDPYRRVLIGQNEPQENVPRVRDRLALSAKWNRFFPALHAALHMNLRGYTDTWGVEAATGEMAWSQYVGNSLMLELHGRVSQQSAATFFKDAFFYETESTAGRYFTGDRELAPDRNLVLGARLVILSTASDEHKVWSVFQRLQFSLKGDLISLDQLPADKTDLNQAGTDRQFLTGGFLNAFALQLSLLATF